MKIFNVPFPLGENQGNLTITTSTPSKPSKEQIINQAIQFHLKGNISEAIKYYRYLINQGFKDHRVFSNYGSILNDLGKSQEAELSTRKAIEIKPDYAESHSNLAMILRDLGKLQEAELSIRKAIELKPDFAEAIFNLGNILRYLGKEKEAIKHYSAALEKKPNNLSLYINSKFNFSRIMKDISQINIERKNYQEQIHILKQKNDMEYKNDKVFNTYIFYLPYHNRSDDKLILEDLSNTLSNIKGVVVNDFSTDKKINSTSKNDHLKMGICSECLRYSHVVGKLYIKVILDLLKTDLEIIIYIPPGKNQFAEYEILKKSFKRVICLPKSPINAKKEIIKDNLDILFYPDIGMSGYTYILSLSRLALVQVNSLGHTNTSGIKNMDYFITSDIEPIESNKNYTERLVRFSRLPFNYSKPIINERNIKNKHIISSEQYFNVGLMQTLFKLHPDYDEILVEILKEIPNSRIILVKDALDSVTEGLKDRWREKNKLLLKRSIFLDKMNNNDFLYIIKNCDIVLDPLYYGSGNTFYESMAFGTPFITYKNQKSKIPIAGYRQMKVSNPPIASSQSDYINLCKAYAMDKNLLSRTRNDLIEKSNQHLFNDNDIYKQYYKFFNEAAEAATNGKYLRSDWCP